MDLLTWIYIGVAATVFLVLLAREQNGKGPSAGVFGLLCYGVAAVTALGTLFAFFFWLGQSSS